MLGGSEGLILIAVIVLLFGGSQIPKLAKNLGLAQKELREGMKSGDVSAASTPDTQSTPDTADLKSDTASEARNSADASSSTQNA